MNNFLNGLKDTANYGYTENGAIKKITTNSALLDMFAMGGAYRSRSKEDVILMFQKAYNEDAKYALKCLFYLRDVREGQGERRFFRICMRWLANNEPEAARRTMRFIPEYGRYDDLYCFVDTSLENDALEILKEAIAEGVTILNAIK